MLRNRKNSSNFVDKDYIKKLTVPIPHDESIRIRLLSESKIIDTSQRDPMYDRFTSLAKRIFEVPMSAITFVTEDHIWFKSAIGMEISDADRNNSFCTYAILPESPQLFVILDTLKDPRFCDNLLVTGPPFIRFFASVPLSIDSVKLGTLCILDIVPHDNFDTVSSLSLLDLGEAVSNLIRQRRQSVLRIKREERLMEIAQLKIMTEVMHSVRTPLMSIGIAISLLETDLKTNSSTVNTVGPSSTQSTIVELKRAVNNLEVAVESKLRDENIFPTFPLDHLHYENQEEKKYENKITGINLLELLHHIRFPTLSPSLSDSKYLSQVDWSIDESFFALGVNYTYPYIIRNILIGLLKDLSLLWKRISVTVRFRTNTISAHRSQKTDIFDDLEIESNILSGYVNIQLRVFQLSPKTEERKSNNEEVTVYMNNICPLSNIKLRIDDTIHDVELQLYDLQGRCKIVDFPESLDQNSADERLYDFKIPCTIQMTEVAGIVGSVNQVKPHLPSDSTSSSDLEQIHSGGSVDDMTTSQFGGQGQGRRSGLGMGSQLSSQLSESTPSSLDQSTRSRELRVLVVEDSIAIQKMMTRWLEGNGCKVTVADNGKYGLTLLQTQKFDMTFMDFLMPVMLGRDTMCSYQKWRNASRRNDINKNMLLIGMSANASEEDLIECFKYGMHAFAIKPIDTKVFSEIVQARRYHQDITAMLEELKSVTALRNCLNEQHKMTATATTTMRTTTTTTSTEAGLPSTPMFRHEARLSQCNGTGSCVRDRGSSLMRVMSVEIDNDKCPYCGELTCRDFLYADYQEERCSKVDGDINDMDLYSRSSILPCPSNYYDCRKRHPPQGRPSEYKKDPCTIVEVGHKLGRQSLVILNPFSRSREGVEVVRDGSNNSENPFFDANASHYYQQPQQQQQQRRQRPSVHNNSLSSCLRSLFRNFRVNSSTATSYPSFPSSNLFSSRRNKSCRVHV